MICPNCQTENINGSNFCIKCGKPLTAPVQTPPQNENVFTPNTAGISNTVPNTQTPVSNISRTPETSTKHINAIKGLFEVIRKPQSAMKEELINFNNIKNAILLTVIVALIATIASLVQTMISVVRVEKYSLFEGTTTTWVWENLKDIEYIKVIGQSFLIFAGIIVGIAAIYYIGGLIIKKQSNFGRMLGIAAVSIFPLYLCAYILSPLLSIIWEPLALIVTMMGSTYSLIIMYETINNEINLEGNEKYYFNLLCLSIILVAVYYVYMKFMISPVVDDLGGILDIFRQ